MSVRQHDPPPARRRRGQGPVLVGERQRAGQRVHVDAGRCRSSIDATRRDLADARQEHQHVAGLLAQGAPHQLAGRRVGPGALLRRRPAEIDRELATVAARSTGAGSAPPSTAANRSASARRRHRQDPQVGPQHAAGVEGEGEADVGRQVALVHLVEDDQPDAGQLGVRLQAAGQHAFGDHLDARVGTDASFVAGLVADEPAGLGAEQRGHSVRGRASRPGGAARASRSCAPRATARSISRSGTSVVLPAPGGATSTARSAGARAPCRQLGRGPPSTTGKVGCRCGHAPRVSRVLACRGTRPGHRRRGWSACSRRSSVAIARRPDATRRRSNPRRTAGTDSSLWMNTNAGSCSRPSALHGRPIGIDEHQELLGQRSEERLGVVGVAGDDEVHPHGRSRELAEDASRRVEDPRALVGVRVDHHRRQVEGRQPVRRACAARDPGESGRDRLGGSTPRLRKLVGVPRVGPQPREGSLGEVADGLDVVAVGIAHERAEVVGVVLRPDPWLVERPRRRRRRRRRRRPSPLPGPVRRTRCATRGSPRRSRRGPIQKSGMPVP